MRIVFLTELFVTCTDLVKINHTLGVDKILSKGFFAFIFSAFLYSVLFYFNDWLTSHMSYGLGVNWIYLPAGLRLFLTLVFALPGALGIATASFLISFFGAFSQDLTTCIGVSLISGFAPYLARFFVMANVPLAADLSDLNMQRLIVCILIYAILSSGLHQWWFAIRALDNTGSLQHFIVMFVGDIIGTLLLIALIKYGLDLLKKTKRAY
jgi:hypothetical protein